MDILSSMFESRKDRKKNLQEKSEILPWEVSMVLEVKVTHR